MFQHNTSMLTMDSKQNTNNISSSLNYTYKCITTLTNPTLHQITCLAVHKSFLYAASINQINVYDLSTYSHITSFTTNNPTSGSIKSIAFHNSKIFTAHQDGKIRIWQQINSLSHPPPQFISTLPTVKDRLRHFILPRNYVTVRRHKKRLWIQHCDTVSGLALHGGRFMYSVSWDKSFKLWNVETNRCLESVNSAHHDAVNTLAVSGNGTVYTGSADGSIRVWERIGNKERRKHSMVATLKKHKSTVNALVLNGDGSVLFSGGFDRSIVVWEKKRDNHDDDRMVYVEALWGHGGAVLCLMNVQDLLVSGSSDRTVRIWQRGGERNDGYICMVVMVGHEKPVKSLVEVSGGGCNGSNRNNRKITCLSICSGSLDGEIKVWEINSNQN